MFCSAMFYRAKNQGVIEMEYQNFWYIICLEYLELWMFWEVFQEQFEAFEVVSK